MVERGASSTRQTTASGSWWSMAIWAASPAPARSLSAVEREELAAALPPVTLADGLEAPEAARLPKLTSDRTCVRLFWTVQCPEDIEA
jgi:hypothetical protein